MESDREKKDEQLYFSTYGHFQQDVLAQVRQETYGEDIGQFSWLTAEEFRSFMDRLDINSNSRVLDVACGSGGPALYMSQHKGCRVTGIDINAAGIANGNQTAEARGLSNRVSFQVIDASQPLPFEDNTFDAITCIDAINHVYSRLEMLREWYRVLRPGGRFIFTDAVIVTGMLTRSEILARSSSMGQFIFTPPGVHDRIIETAGFTDLLVEDVTATIAAVTKRWHDSRATHEQEIERIDGRQAFDDYQLTLSTAHKLSSERRLSRFAYSARKPE